MEENNRILSLEYRQVMLTAAVAGVFSKLNYSSILITLSDLFKCVLHFFNGICEACILTGFLSVKYPYCIRKNQSTFFVSTLSLLLHKWQLRTIFYKHGMDRNNILIHTFENLIIQYNVLNIFNCDKRLNNEYMVELDC